MKSILLKTFAWSLALLVFAGFDYSKHSIPLDDIHDGGPGKDGIPAILKPRFVTAGEADDGLLKNRDRVIGFVYKEKARAYPIKILNWHEIVNDRVAGRSIVVTFCPLCGTGMVFDAMIKKRKMTFGVSGLLYQSDLLLYDHQTESLWSQIESEAVTGPLTGTRLKLLSSTHTTWGQWKKKYPETRVLSDQTGFRRDYDRDPYAGYDRSPRLIFGVDNVSAKFHPKEKVIGIELAGAAKAYPFSELEKAGGSVKDKVKGKPIVVQYDKSSRTAIIRDNKGKELPSVVGFWFAWYTFHPQTEVYTEKQR
ncbi:hypothetical protein UR09_00215 [Candidatus Nitromaritima sp. SCGC AAA799-A02]|nr:hypothetical protein UZ36_00210 [Candidatus Nitromaritima sp. SCGC AAA799-C22]KMP12744.1 hypothetical protein UR09_00215 [Candidatus Nitromaritima sp. SCGC AAA799-A02]